MLLHKLAVQKSELKDQAVKEVIPLLLESAKCSSQEESVKAGYGIYHTPVLTDKPGKEPLITVMWIGKRKNVEGYNVRGGLLDELYFKSAYKITITTEAVFGSAPDRNLYSSGKAEILPLSWGELVDTLYDNLFTSAKEQA